MLVWLNERFRAIRRRLFGGGPKAAEGRAAKNIRREREIFRRWSRRSVEDRFTL